MLKAIGRAVSWLVTLVLAIALACNVYIISARMLTGNPQPDIFGWSWAVVVSGSMAPQIEVNDLVVIHEENDYVPGDVITYRSGSTPVTHRIVEEGEEGFVTRGDANNAPDPAPVRPEQILGKVVAVIPGVGLFTGFLRTPLGMLCLVAVGFLLIEISYLLEKGSGKKGGRGYYEKK